jgi:hypothetical protein
MVPINQSTKLSPSIEFIKIIDAILFISIDNTILLCQRKIEYVSS